MTDTINKQEKAYRFETAATISADIDEKYLDENDDEKFFLTEMARKYPDKLLELINKAILDDFSSMNPELGLGEYWDKSARFILKIPAPTAQNLTDNLCFNLVWEVYASRELTFQEQKEVKKYIDGQCSDGWGGGVFCKQQPIYLVLAL